LMLIQNKMKIK